jgi:hypothetical protein
MVMAAPSASTQSGKRMTQISGKYFVELTIQQEIEISPEDHWDQDDVVEHVRVHGRMVDWNIRNTNGRGD